MNKIRVYTRYDEKTDTRLSEMAEIVGVLPVVGDVDGNLERDGYCSVITRIEKEEIDVEQGNDIVYEYDYYRVYTEEKSYNYDDELEVERDNYLIAIKREG